jgi:DNA-binding transcriptional ArsR family regulator
MSLLPSRGPDTSTSQEGELQVVGVDDEVAPLLDALNSETARAILNEIYSDPGTPSEIADRLDMSIQKVSYHIEKLEEQELIDVAGTQYSEKGQEMTVYQPPEEPTVLFVGTEERKRSLTTMVKRLLPVVAVVALGSLVIERLFGSGLSFGLGSSGAESGVTDGGGSGDAGAAGDAGGTQVSAESANSTGQTATDTPTATQTATETAADGGDGGGDIGIAEVTETQTPTGGATRQATGTQTAEPASTATPAETATSDPIATETATEPPSTAVSEGMGATETPVPDAEATDIAYETTAQATELAASGGLDLSPGLAFFLGGMTVVAVLAVWWSYTNYT